jgi:signal transduction histidine kinase
VTAPPAPGRSRALSEHLAVLAAHLAQRRAAVLQIWRQAVHDDPAMSTGQSLSRAQINDHIPSLLAAFERDLLRPVDPAPPPPPGTDIETETAADAEAHGLHRWHQGYDLSEVTRELGHLNECVSGELEDFAQANPSLPPAVMAEARRRWARACTVAIAESTTQFFLLQQLEAAGHIEELEGALDELREIEGLRAALWQQAAHDLRGNVAVVSNATAGLAHRALPENTRERFLGLLQRNVQALNHLLNDVTSLARLQAGEEKRQVQPLDAAALLRDLTQSLAGVAEQRGLILQCDGPAQLLVEGDAIKTRRIAQNLILNALTYTEEGGVDVRWGDAPQGDGKRWAMTLRDTGPGMHGGRGALLAGALEHATAMNHGQAGQDPAATDGAVNAATARPPGPQRGPQRSAGEGLGLSIVKRLCDLLDATVEVQSDCGVGTTFTILFPRAYPPPARPRQ